MIGSPTPHARARLYSLARMFGSSLLLTAASTGAFAQPIPADQIDSLRRQLEELRSNQDKTAERISSIEATLNKIARVPPLAPGISPTVATIPDPAPAPAVGTAGNSKATSGFQISGDVRVRYESNLGDQDARNRDRGVARARLRANYTISSNIMTGAQISTGDDDDPNTADITLSNWDDDLRVSLDQLFLRGTFGNLVMTAGKLPQPFRRTDLVWDGDVSPQGLSAAYRQPIGGGASIKASGLYFQIEEASRGPDSSMIGGQIEFATAPGTFHAELAAAYYDYRLNSMAGADTGDLRSNLLLSSGHYKSDFNLFDVVGTATFNGLSDRWPIQLIGNFVHNYGAAVDDDTGYGLDLFIGRASKPKDWRFGYGYSRAEVDAVLAAFSHDNIDIATNYRLHALSVDHVPSENMLLNLTWYQYRPLSPLYAGTNELTDWLSRVRLNYSVSF